MTHQIPDVKARVRISSRKPIREEAYPGVVAGKDNLAALVHELQYQLKFCHLYTQNGQCNCTCIR